MAVSVNLIKDKLDRIEPYGWRDYLIYRKNDVVHLNGLIYRSLVDNNVKNNPIYSNEWKQII